jgi:hypothetical protein
MSSLSMCIDAARRGAGAWLALWLAAAPPAQAALGEPWTAAMNPGGGKNLQSVAPAVSNSAYQMHQTQTAEGTTVREYSDASGIVFAVSWSGPFKPDLQQLLGAYFKAFRDAPRVPGGAALRGTQRIDNGGIVVHTGGRPRAFFGRAFVPALVPAGVDVQVLP